MKYRFPNDCGFSSEYLRKENLSQYSVPTVPAGWTVGKSTFAAFLIFGLALHADRSAAQTVDSVYEAYPSALQLLADAPTRQQRVGNRYWAGRGHSEAVRENASRDSHIHGSGIWLRADIGLGTADPDRSSTQAEYDIDTYEAQMGVDGVLWRGEQGAIIGGLTAQYATAETDVSSSLRSDDITTSAYGIGATLTYYGASGFYADVQGRYTWLDSNLGSSSQARRVRDNDAKAYVLSLELGHRVPISESLSLTPQGQLQFSRVNFETFVGPDGERVVNDANDHALIGRFGLSLDSQRSWIRQNGKVDRYHLYGIANLYHDFLSGTRIDVDRRTLVSNVGDWTGELGLGGSYSWSDGLVTVFGEVSFATSLDDIGDSTRNGVVAGVRIGW
ncbi:MAG: autotransporter outer membrane beta-barrel domain-containing protein [Pseudomonadota bacterium]